MTDVVVVIGHSRNEFFITQIFNVNVKKKGLQLKTPDETKQR